MTGAWCFLLIGATFAAGEAVAAGNVHVLRRWTKIYLFMAIICLIAEAA